MKSSMATFPTALDGVFETTDAGCGLATAPAAAAQGRAFKTLG